MKERAVGAVAVAAFVWLLLSVCGGWVSVRSVHASASWHPDNGPKHAVDGLTQETPNGSASWLLPDGQLGEIRFTFDGTQRLDEALILNSRNRLFFDRATARYRLALVDEAGAHVVDEGTLPPYPEWKTIPLGGRAASAAILYVDSFTGVGGGLSEVSFRGEPDSLVRFWPLAVALALGALVARFYPALSTRFGGAARRPSLLLAALLAALTAIGLRALHHYTAVSVFEWLLLYDVHEFKTFAETRQFLSELRIPIPPWLAVAEIVTQNLTGSIDLVSRDLYLLSIIGANAIAVVLAYPSPARMLATAVAAAVCIAGTGPVHQANPQIYDTVFGLLLVALIGLLEWSTRAAAGSRLRTALLGAAGVVLSLWGLTRPFALALLPLPIAFVALRFPDQRRRGWLAFLAPVVLLCGVWHAQLLLRHGQLGMSNHTGYNLQRAWPMVQWPELPPEQVAPPYRGANNPDHGRNSKLLQRAFLQYVVEHPVDAVLHMVERVDALLEVRTDFPQRHAPKGPLVATYQLVVRLLMGLALLTLVARVAQLVAHARQRFERTELRVSDLSLVLLAGTMLMIAVGEAGEESRFVISFLPLLVAVLASSDVVPHRYPFEGQAPQS